MEGSALRERITLQVSSEPLYGRGESLNSPSTKILHFLRDESGLIPSCVACFFWGEVSTGGVVSVSGHAPVEITEQRVNGLRSEERRGGVRVEAALQHQ